MRSINSLGLVLGLFLPKLLLAQTAIDTIFPDQVLAEVSVTSGLNSEYGIAHHRALLDSATLSQYAGQSLSQVLAGESTFFVKNYGPGGIATLSGRGGSAAHTAVLWEGIAIQNPMLGQTDISLLPAFLFDEVALQYGAESALIGNGSIGGGILLRSATAPQEGTTVGLQSIAGSFKQVAQQAKISFTKGRYALTANAYWQQATNNIKFRDINAFGSPKPIKRQTNAATQQVGALLTAAYRYKQHHFSIKTWWQSSERQVPPNLLQLTSEDQQIDASWRNVFAWKLQHKQAVTRFQSSFATEFLDFFNAGIDSRSNVRHASTQLQHNRYLNTQHKLIFSTTYDYFWANSTGYPFTPQQHRLSLMGAYKAFWKKLQTTLSLREELVNGKAIRPALSFAATAPFATYWKWRGMYSMNYRLPTFNDLYWGQLGNPDLNPEFSHNTEIGLDFRRKKTTVKATLFTNWVNDWILWTPNLTGTWRPGNIEKVWARGLELNLNRRFNLGTRLALSLSANYAFTKSTGQKSQDALRGKQLIYVPVHNAGAGVQLRFRSGVLRYQHQVVSKRFIDKENTLFLKGYHTGNIYADYLLKFSDYSGSVFIRFNNIWGADYQVVSNRPMPWQSIQVGIRAAFSK